MTLKPFALYSGSDVSVTVLIALLVCLIPTTIGALLSAIGIAGMDRVLQHNILAMSGRAVEASGDVNVLLLDKTGTITLGNRQATEFVPAPGVDARRRLPQSRNSRRSPMRRPRDARSSYWPKSSSGCAAASCASSDAHVRSVHRQRRGCRVSTSRTDARVRKGAADAVGELRRRGRRRVSRKRCAKTSRASAARAARRSSSSTKNASSATIYLKDIVKGGMKERFDRLRMMGIRTVMITGDNPLTAATIAREAGVDDFLAEATPEDKLALIRKEQAKGNLVAMTGDGTNDAPALAQADVGVAMNTGTQAAKEAGNMVDLDSNPTKLIEVVEIGKQLLMTRGALTTFSIANDVAKYFAIIPALFLATLSATAGAEHHASGHAAKRDPLRGDLQRAGHRRARAAGVARRRSTAPSARRAFCAAIC